MCYPGGLVKQITGGIYIYIYCNYHDLMNCVNAYRILVGKPEGKRPLGRPRGDDSIKRDLRENGLD
jgi:hypothetical protein